MQVLGIIPARYASSRFPGKPLAMIQGVSMLERVYRQVEKTQKVDEVIVATDDQRIFDHACQFGGQVMMTDPGHRSGTDRCAEVAARFGGSDIVINIQGDEPFIDPRQIDTIIEPLEKNEAQISTLARRLEDENDIFNPNVVKVVIDRLGKAMYFSRSTIPYLRNVPREQWPALGVFYKHIGLYGFHRKALLELTALEDGLYEKAESLEQLRWLEAGYSIQVSITEEETIGIDTPEDLEKVNRLLKKND